MRKIALALALTLGLAGCAQLQSTWSFITQVQVSPQQVYVAENAFDGIEQTAANYLHWCRIATPRPSACAASTIKNMRAAVRTGRAARDQLDAYLKAHPTAIGATGLYDALVSATSVLQAYNANFGAAK